VLGTVPFAVAGISLLAQAGGGLYWALAGAILAVVGAVLNAWVLLVEILR
jgi:modulator of FtsH protease